MYSCMSSKVHKTSVTERVEIVTRRTPGRVRASQPRSFSPYWSCKLPQIELDDPAFFYCEGRFQQNGRQQRFAIEDEGIDRWSIHRFHVRAPGW